MRAFIVLCLVAMVKSDKLGYDYRQGSHANLGFKNFDIRGLSSNYVTSKSLGSSYGGLSALNSYSGGLNFLNGGSGRSLAAAPEANYEVPSYAPAVEYDKEFYSFAAPDQEFDDPLASQKIATALRKNLKVVFIKGPENKGLENAALALAKQAAEQKTAIYVLNKQTDISDLADKFNALRSHQNSRPDVHFVKYRTSEDAANAQREIQAQYDNDLQGLTRNVDGGIAPVINFASRGPSRPVLSREPENSYLPASILRRLRY